MSLSKEEFINRSKHVHGDKYDYSKVEYTKIDSPVTIICPKHGDFPQIPINHLQGCGCPNCNASHLETKTKVLLERNSIRFKQRKRFSWLKSSVGGSMSLDFYLPDYNAAIECQGIQHYEPKGIFTEEKVNYTKELDKLKAKLCKQNNVKLYYIKYDDNVEGKINELLNSIKNIS